MTAPQISFAQLLWWQQEHLLRAFLTGPDAGRGPAIPIDVIETAQEYLLTADIAGSARELIQVELHGGEIRMRIECCAVAADSGYRRLLTEREQGPRSRTVTLPQPIDRENAHGSYRDGVLVLHLPKLSDRSRRLPMVG